MKELEFEETSEFNYYNYCAKIKNVYVIFNISEFIDIYKLSSHSWLIKFNCQQKNRKHKALCRQAVTAIMKNDTLLTRSLNLEMQRVCTSTM